MRTDAVKNVARAVVFHPCGALQIIAGVPTASHNWSAEYRPRYIMGPSENIVVASIYMNNSVVDSGTSIATLNVTDVATAVVTCAQSQLRGSCVIYLRRFTFGATRNNRDHRECTIAISWTLNIGPALKYIYTRLLHKV